MADAQSIRNATGGIDDNGWPWKWRWAFSRHPREFGDVVNDPERRPWERVQPDGQTVKGHTDAFEQIVPINEQIAWRHVFSDGIERDSGDVLLELMEFAIQWRTENGYATSAFVASAEGAVPAGATRKATTRAPSKKPPR